MPNLTLLTLDTQLPQLIYEMGEVSKIPQKYNPIGYQDIASAMLCYYNIEITPCYWAFSQTLSGKRMEKSCCRSHNKQSLIPVFIFKR